MFEKLLLKISRNLAKNKIPYMIIGGQAVLIYGEPRLTKDIDITLGAGIDTLELIVNIAKKLGLKILINDHESFVKKTMTLPLQDLKSGIRIDLIFSFSTYESQALKRAKSIKIGAGSVKYASLEDVVIHKIIASRPRDIEDVKSILLKNPRFDIKYILKWLKEFDQALDSSYIETFKKLLK